MAHPRIDADVQMAHTGLSETEVSAPDAGAAQRLEAHFQLHLYHGEIYCEREPGVFYLQVFAPQERAVQVLLEDAADCVPGVTAQYKSVPKD